MGATASHTSGLLIGVSGTPLDAEGSSDVIFLHPFFNSSSYQEVPVPLVIFYHLMNKPLSRQ